MTTFYELEIESTSAAWFTAHEISKYQLAVKLGMCCAQARFLFLVFSGAAAELEKKNKVCHNPRKLSVFSN